MELRNTQLRMHTKAHILATVHTRPIDGVEQHTRRWNVRLHHPRSPRPGDSSGCGCWRGYRLGEGSEGPCASKSTASKQINGISKASPDFIAAVLTRHPFRFEAAFEIVPLADATSPSATASTEELSDA